MGQSKSKEGRRKKTPKNQQQPTESSDPSDPNAPPKVDENGNHLTDGENTEGNTNDDESSSSGVEDNDLEENAIIFSKNKQVVTKDDFELLTVIGKGSFGKVWDIVFHIFRRFLSSKFHHKHARNAPRIRTQILHRHIYLFFPYIFESFTL